MPRFHVGGSVFHSANVRLESVPLTETELTNSDVVVIVTGHHSVDYKVVAAHAPLIVDTTNVTANLETRDQVVRLGAPSHAPATNGGLY